MEINLPKKGEKLTDRWGTLCEVEHSSDDFISVREAGRKWDSFENERVDIKKEEFKYFFPFYEPK